MRVLSLLPKNEQAKKLAEAGLGDDKPEVRSAAALALGEMQSRSSIPKLKESLSDKEITVMLAAAHALGLMHDNAAYEVYYEILTGERKTSKGLIAEQTATLKDPKKLAELGIQEGIGFIPFAGIGWEAYRRLAKSDPSPVRAAAAKALAKDPDPASARALADAVKDDKNWIVRAAALEAIAKRGDPSSLQVAEMAMSDDETENARRWATLPPVYWTAPVAKLKLGAQALVVDPDPAKATVGADPQEKGTRRPAIDWLSESGFRYLVLGLPLSLVPLRRGL